MDKQKLVRFINKYYLGGIGESVLINSSASNQTLTTKFVSGDKNLLGTVEMSKWVFEDANLGVYNTEQLMKLLGVLENDIRVDVTKSESKAISMKISDSMSSVNYMLSDPSIINEPPPLKTIPDFELSIDLTNSVINKFISGKSALSETSTFTVVSNGETTQLIIGYSSVNTNRVTIPVTTTQSSDIDNVSFSADYFSAILTANKECESALLQVSSAGLAKMTFKVDDYSSEYYLVATQDVD